jgi:hypothetical protein
MPDGREFDLTYKVIEKCNENNVEYLNYDPQGVGHSVNSTIERTTEPLAFECFPMNAGDSVSDKYYEEFGRSARDVFLNAKSEWWYNLSILFKNTWEFVKHGIYHEPSEMISIPNNGELRTQLSTPQKIWKNNGKIMVETKEMLAARGVPSPDMADATVLANIGKDTTFKRVWTTYKNAHYRSVNINFKDIDAAFSQLFIVLVYDKSTGIYGNCFFWGRKSRALRVYAEIHHDNPIVDVVAADIRDKAVVALESTNSLTASINKIYGTDNMFSGGDDWAYTLRKKGRIRIAKANNYDEAAAVVIARTMFGRNQIIIDKDLVETNMQYKNWRVKDNKPDDGYPFCTSLCMAVSVLRNAGELATGEGRIHKPYSREKQRIRDKLQTGVNPYQAIGIGGRTTRAAVSEYDYMAQ